jgi:hypothetical protein
LQTATPTRTLSEKASVGEHIAPFANFLAGLVKKRLAGEPLPAVPKASLLDKHPKTILDLQGVARKDLLTGCTA